MFLIPLDHKLFYFKLTAHRNGEWSGASSPVIKEGFDQTFRLNIIGLRNSLIQISLGILP